MIWQILLSFLFGFFICTCERSIKGARYKLATWHAKRRKDQAQEGWSIDNWKRSAARFPPPAFFIRFLFLLFFFFFFFWSPKKERKREREGESFSFSFPILFPCADRSLSYIFPDVTTGHFTITEPQNLTIDVSEIHEIPISADCWGSYIDIWFVGVSFLRGYLAGIEKAIGRAHYSSKPKLFHS